MTMRRNTLMWNTFMTRGQNKCIIMVEYKGKEEDVYIPPHEFDKTFEELGILSGGQITLIEMKVRKGIVEDDSDGASGEGGEDDMEDMEAELEENGQAEGEDREEKPTAAEAGVAGSASRQDEALAESAAKEGGAAELSSPTAMNVAAVNSETQPFVP